MGQVQPCNLAGIICILYAYHVLISCIMYVLQLPSKELLEAPWS